MPNNTRPIETEKKTRKSKIVPTVEVDGYLSGLYKEFHEQVSHYQSLTHHLAELEARTEIAEKNLRVTRDHLALAVEKARSVTIPPDWTRTLKSVQFVGVRLVDACVALLREQQRMTPAALLRELNLRMFRFRTSAPLREIHGALLRHSNVQREGDEWVWCEEGNQTALRLRVLTSEVVETSDESKVTTTAHVIAS
jgi:hypothetical protein